MLNEVVVDPTSGEWLYTGSLHDAWAYLDQDLSAEIVAGSHGPGTWRVHTTIPGRDGEAPWSVATTAPDESTAWRLHVGRLLSRGTSPEGLSPGTRLASLTPH